MLFLEFSLFACRFPNNESKTLYFNSKELAKEYGSKIRTAIANEYRANGITPKEMVAFDVIGISGAHSHTVTRNVEKDAKGKEKVVITETWQDANGMDVCEDSLRAFVLERVTTKKSTKGNRRGRVKSPLTAAERIALKYAKKAK